MTSGFVAKGALLALNSFQCNKAAHRVAQSGFKADFTALDHGFSSTSSLHLSGGPRDSVRRTWGALR